MDRSMNEIQRATLAKVEDMLDTIHHADLTVRVDGKDHVFEADWIRQVITVFTLLEQTIEMNGDEAFWQHLGKLPVSKFVGSMRERFAAP